ncbi:MAG: type II toxin-antitoxin system RelE/ParE family toxin [Chlamydiia bacterium]|nr:type II toxin-antitoxin system RelE/ParE family toxin [Chlamydiia bacterium]
MEIEIEFYITSNGECPFDVWLEGIKDLKTKTKILTRLDRVRIGNFGDFKGGVGEGVSELRMDYGAGIRMYYSKIGNKVILLLCGGTKRSQEKNIKTAEEYLKEYHSRGKKK